MHQFSGSLDSSITETKGKYLHRHHLRKTKPTIKHSLDSFILRNLYLTQIKIPFPFKIRHNSESTHDRNTYILHNVSDIEGNQVMLQTWQGLFMAQKHDRHWNVTFSLCVEFLMLSQQVPVVGEEKKALKYSFFILPALQWGNTSNWSNWSNWNFILKRRKYYNRAKLHCTEAAKLPAILSEPIRATFDVAHDPCHETVLIKWGWE